MGLGSEAIEKVYLAGAFGNYVDRRSAARIGLIPLPTDRIAPAGNTALLGAKIALFQGAARDYAPLMERIEHVPLSMDSRFQEIFMDELRFKN